MDTVDYLRRGEFLRTWIPILLLPIGAVMLYVGVVVGMSCQAYYPFSRSCAEQAYQVPGYVTAFVGLCFVLVGVGALLARGGEDAPPREPALHIADPVLSERVDRDSRLLFVGIVGVGLAAAEAFPLYGLTMQSLQGNPPSFSLPWFLADLVVFAIADLLVLFALYQWTESQ